MVVMKVLKLKEDIKNISIKTSNYDAKLIFLRLGEKKEKTDENCGHYVVASS